MPLKPISIIGGGIAGLALGIGLRREGIPVIVYEAGRYPRHRVCGEFISGKGQAVIGLLGLHDRFMEQGAIMASTAAFFHGELKAPVRPLPNAALCLSRFELDALLAGVFIEKGGELRAGQRWDGSYDAGVVRATGRRPCPPARGGHWFGIKVHASNVRLDADLEMHVSPSDYVGVCRLPGGKVNVCGLFRRSSRASNRSASALDRLRGRPGSSLEKRMQSAVFDEGSLCSVAGFSLAPVHAITRPECCIGDALALIPPVTGNGMSMALEAAYLSIAPLAAYSRGEVDWAQARIAIAGGCDQAFAQRLRWANWLHLVIFFPVFGGCFNELTLRCGGMWRLLFSKTR